jgi:ABC-type transporter Mla subunit MlaD
MSHPELRQILTDLAAAQGALQRSSAAFDTAMDGMQLAIAGIKAANQAQGEAIGATVRATEQALHLFNSTERH